MKYSEEIIKRSNLNDFPFDDMHKVALDVLKRFDELDKESREKQWCKMLTADSCVNKIIDAVKESDQIETAIENGDDLIGTILTIVGTYALVGIKQGWAEEAEAGVGQ